MWLFKVKNLKIEIYQENVALFLTEIVIYNCFMQMSLGFMENIKGTKSVVENCLVRLNFGDANLMKNLKLGIQMVLLNIQNYSLRYNQ